MEAANLEAHWGIECHLSAALAWREGFGISQLGASSPMVTQRKEEGGVDYNKKGVT